MWYGEQWYMQTDAHMTFAQNWDQLSIDMLQRAPSKKPVLSHYPPSHMADLEGMADKPASRLCGPMFATSDLEAQIVRLEGGAVYDKTFSEIPRFAPFTAAGYFVAHSDFLREVPFDPFLPCKLTIDRSFVLVPPIQYLSLTLKWISFVIYSIPTSPQIMFLMCL